MNLSEAAQRWASAARTNRRQRQALHERPANCASAACHCYVAQRFRLRRLGMRRLRSTSSLFVLLICVSIAQGTQDYSARLISVADKLKTHLVQSRPEWRHSSVESIKGSRNVSVNNWELNSHLVRVSILA